MIVTRVIKSDSKNPQGYKITPKKRNKMMQDAKH